MKKILECSAKIILYVFITKGICMYLKININTAIYYFLLGGGIAITNKILLDENILQIIIRKMQALNIKATKLNLLVCCIYVECLIGNLLYYERFTIFLCVKAVVQTVFFSILECLVNKKILFEKKDEG